MTFPTYWLFGFLNHMGWPRTTGLFRRRKIVSHLIVCSAVRELVHSAIALGVERPNTAIKLLADLLIKRDWSQQSVKELWNALDPSEKVSNQPEKSPEEIIASFPMTVPDPTNPEEVQQDLIAWENVLTENFSAHYHWVFSQGLVWGFIHPKEALAHHEKQRKKYLTRLPEMLQAGLDVHPIKPLEELANAIENLVDSFQNEFHPFGEIPQELASLPAITTRLGST
jgi:hypothetical protein